MKIKSARSPISSLAVIGLMITLAACNTTPPRAALSAVRSGTISALSSTSLTLKGQTAIRLASGTVKINGHTVNAKALSVG